MHHIIPAITVATADRLLNSYCIGRRPSWAVLKASGSTIREYLQGQITQDISRLTHQQGIHACILTPQGKAVSELYVLEGHRDELVLLVPSQSAIKTVARLRQFLLGHEVCVGVVDELAIYALQGAHASQGIADFALPESGDSWLTTTRQDDTDIFVLTMPADPRGFWVVANRVLFDAQLKGSDKLTDETEFEAMRIIRGFPRFGVEWDESLHPLNANLLDLDGISFDKGCYVGQEVTSRMHWRGTIRKKLYRVQIDRPPADIPCPIITQTQVGELRSAAIDPEGQCFGIALLSVETVESGADLHLEDGSHVSILGACHV
ncbi:MAG: YgfZ/GcvT domain-containing protein [Mariprofundaceae bacterium]